MRNSSKALRYGPYGNVLGQLQERLAGGREFQI